MRITTITEAVNTELRKQDGVRKTEEKQASKFRAPQSDRTEFSSDAQKLSDTRAQTGIVAAQLSSQPEVRPEKVAEVKQKIDQGYYNTDEFADKLADKLLEEFGVKKSSA